MIRRSIVPPYCATGSAQSLAHREKMFEEWAASRNMYTRGMADDALMGLGGIRGREHDHLRDL